MKVVATAGHVDHGKSALLRAITGMEPDRWEEERRRGLTIDLGYVWTELACPETTETVTVAFVDVPGHSGYLANMLAGVGVVQHALLVVAGDDGWAAQSQEHLEILEILDIEVIAVAVTKADLVDDGRIEEVSVDVRTRLASAGRGAPEVVPVAALAGTGIDRLRSLLAQRLGSSHPAVRSMDLPARLRIDRAFRVRGSGSVVTGMLQAGALAVGQDVVVLPAGSVGHVRGLQQLGVAVDRAEQGARVAVDLGRVPHEQLERGVVLVGQGSHPIGRATTLLDVELKTLDRIAVGRTGAWHIHLGTSFSAAHVQPIFGDVEPGATGVVRLELEQPIPTWFGDRFVLRDSGRDWTVGGGTVLDPHPLELPRGTDERFALALTLEELARASVHDERVAALVDAHAGVRAVRDVEDALGRGIGPVEGIDRVADMLVRRDRLTGWVDAILAAAVASSSDHAVDAARLAHAAVAAGCTAPLARAVVGIAVERGTLVNFGGRFVHQDHAERYRGMRSERQAALIGALDAVPLEPPDPAGPLAAASIPSFEVQELLDDGRVVICGPLYFTGTAIDDAVQRLLDGPGASGAAFSASDARQAWETTRRCAVPLLEHLQSTGRTVFDGTEHRLRER